MNLAIIVVYLVSKNNEKLLKVHLDHIEKYTTSPYKLYASINLLDKSQEQYLNNHPKITLCNCSSYDGPIDRDRALYEHSYYLDNLIDHAIEEGATHFAIFHPDSFPIKKNWELILDEYLKSNCKMVTLKFSPTACMFFKSDFIKSNRVVFTPKSQIQQNSNFISFLKKTNLIFESGITYKYAAYLNDLIWHELKRTNKVNDHYHFGGIYGDLIFHLGSAEHKDRSFPEQKEFNIFKFIKTVFGKYLSPGLKSCVRKHLSVNSLSLQSKSRQHSFENIRNSLYEDPNKYIQYLRKGL